VSSVSSLVTAELRFQVSIFTRVCESVSNEHENCNFAGLARGLDHRSDKRFLGRVIFTIVTRQKICVDSQKLIRLCYPVESRFCYNVSNVNVTILYVVFGLVFAIFHIEYPAPFSDFFIQFQLQHETSSNLLGAAASSF
jgi:hypothetical protein